MLFTSMVVQADLCMAKQYQFCMSYGCGAAADTLQWPPAVAAAAPLGGVSGYIFRDICERTLLWHASCTKLHSVSRSKKSPSVTCAAADSAAASTVAWDAALAPLSMRSRAKLSAWPITRMCTR